LIAGGAPGNTVIGDYLGQRRRRRTASTAPAGDAATSWTANLIAETRPGQAPWPTGGNGREGLRRRRRQHRRRIRATRSAFKAAAGVAVLAGAGNAVTSSNAISPRRTGGSTSVRRVPLLNTPGAGPDAGPRLQNFPVGHGRVLRQTSADGTIPVVAGTITAPQGTHSPSSIIPQHQRHQRLRRGQAGLGGALRNDRRGRQRGLHGDPLGPGRPGEVRHRDGDRPVGNTSSSPRGQEPGRSGPAAQNWRSRTNSATVDDDWRQSWTCSATLRPARPYMRSYLSAKPNKSAQVAGRHPGPPRGVAGVRPSLGSC